MHYPLELIEGTFLKRYKRFLVDVRLADGSIVVAHCPNTGSMLGINCPLSSCLLLDSASPTRKCRYTLEAIEVDKHWVGAHPARANAVGKEAILAGLVSELRGVKALRAEVAYGQNSRADWVAELSDGTAWTIEIKSASMAFDRVSMFPDAVTQRGLKHLNELASLVQKGHRAMMLFVATRDDVEVFRPARHIDPAYAKRLKEVVGAGVIARAITSRVSPSSMEAVREIGVDLAGG